MVEIDVNDDTRKAPTAGVEKFFALKEDGVRVGEMINRAVEEDALNEIFRVIFAQVFGSSTDEVAKQGSDAGGIGRLCKMEVGEEVQSL